VAQLLQTRAAQDVLYVLSVWLHVVAATVWVGSMVFFAAIIVPVARRDDVKKVAPFLVRTIGARFRVLGRISLIALVLTGVSNLYLHGFGIDVLRQRAFWETPFGRTLAWKLVFVALTIGVTAAHEWSAASATLTRESSAVQTERARKIASWVGRGIMVASLCILFFAVTLVRGMP
jgi:putative copper resistance protein D